MKNHITANQVNTGVPIKPIHRIQIMSADEWELLIEEWLDTKKDQYIEIERFGGAGDMGRDVVGFITNQKKDPKNYQWDCYQCKHYTKSLAPSDIWVELGKMIYYTFTNEFPVPENYYFVAPKGVGTLLSSLLNDPEKLKNRLKENWSKHCEKSISSNKEIMLTDQILTYFNDFDFSIFGKIAPKQVLNEHKKHPNHLQYFGGGLPNRESEIAVPSIGKDNHLRFIEQLTKAYNSDSNVLFQDTLSITNSKYGGHFKRSRLSFYTAEELRAFTRDNLPKEVYDNFKSDIYESVINIAEDDFENNGFTKLKKVENQASKTSIESNPLREVCQTIDKKGVCHQLVNESELTWVDDE